MITAAVTAAVAALLSLFGIKPGPYLVVVAIGVKIIVVLGGVLLGARVVRRRAAAKAAQAASSPPTDTGTGPHVSP